jgi:hypothetical protein
MPLLVFMVALGLAYLALAALLRRLKSRWNKLGNSEKLAQASFIALLSTLQSFLQVALLTFGGFALLVLLAWLISPFLAGSLLASAHRIATTILEGSSALKGWLGRTLLWLSLVGLFWTVWHRRGERLAGPLRCEHAKQSKDLAEKQRALELPPLEPNREMMAVFREIAVFGDLSTGRINIPPGMTPHAAAAKYGRLVDKLLALDIERRVDLTGMTVDPIDPDEARQWWPALRLRLFSKGVVGTLGWGSKAAGRLGTAAACLLILGVGAPAVATKGLRPYLAHIEDLAVLRSREQAESTLAALFSAPPSPAAADDPPPGAYSNTARLFLSSIADAPEWRDPAVISDEAALDIGQPQETLAERTTVADFALRDAILREAATSGPDEGRRLQVVSLDGEALPDNSRSGYEKLVARLSSPEPGTEGKLARLLQAAAARNPAIKKAIAEYGRSFHRPATLWDYGSVAFSDLFGRAADAALPEVPGIDNPFVEKPWKSAHKGLETAAEHYVRERFARFLSGLETGSVSSARSALEPSRGAMSHFTAEERRAVSAFTARVTQERAAIGGALPTAPSIERVTGAEERAFIGRTRALLGADDPGSAVALLGGYDDIFPGSVSRRATTAFQQSFANGGAATRSELAVLTARDWARLDVDRHVGGVLIGLTPQGQADYRDIVWRRKGSIFNVSLVDGAGRLYEVGSFDPATIQQAIAYAADGRLTAVTITAGAGALRIQLHPVFDATMLGCDIILLDELVFAQTEHNPAWEAWRERVLLQNEIYNAAATAVREGRIPTRFPTPAMFEGWRAADRRTSVLAHYRNAFDPTLVEAIDACRSEAQPHNSLAFWKCVFSLAEGSSATERRIGLRSGVREVPYPLSGAGALQPIKRGGTWPLTFKYLAVLEEENGKEPDTPWSFPPLGDLAQRSVEALAVRDPETASLLARVERFTVLQRVVRLALRNQLAASFPKARLLDLLREAKAAGSIPHVVTPVWGSTASDLSGSLRDLGKRSRAVVASLESLQARLSRTAPRDAQAITPCIASLKSPPANAATSGTNGENCNDLLARHGYRFDIARRLVAEPHVIPVILRGYGDRLRDTGQCRAVTRKRI